MSSTTRESRAKIISLNIDSLSYDEALAHILSLAKSRQPGYVCFANVHMTIEGYQDQNFADRVNAATLVVPDGMPLVKSLKLVHKKKAERIAGMDFMPSIIDSCTKENLSIFLFGSTELVLKKLADKILENHPTAKIAGTISPPFRELNEPEVKSFIEQINNSGANVVLVGLGCPKQENWMAQYSKSINATLLGVGGAFSVYAGLVTRAPRWMQKFALEWLYRLIQEPKRMWKRYLITNTLFIYLLVKQIIQRK